jgi:3-hydroxyacyl-[acyl-carrier protein] dehydratase/trans-2-decenoyl-[acyl-carrier protein] isomerase
MKYTDILKKTSFKKEELLAFAYGTLSDDIPQDTGRLPIPPMLMVDRITEISREQNNSFLIAERDVRLDDWFFHCHFLGDPVQPGCLGVDAVWQLLGFFCVVSGAQGTGRALGCKEVNFSGQIRPHNKVVRYEIKIRRYQVKPSDGTAVVIGSGKVFVDDELIYEINDAKVGTFSGIKYGNYPLPGPNSKGGQN